MKKIKTVFKIDRVSELAINELNANMEWVLEGDGIATVKFDGTSVFYQNGHWYKRFDRKLSKKGQRRRQSLLKKGDAFILQDSDLRVLPEGAIALEQAPDPVTFHYPYWVPAPFDLPENKYLKEAVESLETVVEEGSYELIGPSVNCNPYALTVHRVVKHGASVIEELSSTRLSFEIIRQWLINNDGEGLVFHHEHDGRMAKIRRKDFRLVWNPESDPRN